MSEILANLHIHRFYKNIVREKFFVVGFGTLLGRAKYLGLIYSSIMCILTNYIYSNTKVWNGNEKYKQLRAVKSNYLDNVLQT